MTHGDTMIDTIESNPMDHLRMLAVYLVIGGAIVAVLNLPKLGGLRRGFDWFVNGSNANLGSAKRFADIGARFAYVVDAGVSKHEATIGLKALSTAITALLGLMLIPGMTGLNGLLAVACLGVIGGYYLIHIWRYRIDVAGDAPGDRLQDRDGVPAAG